MRATRYSLIAISFGFLTCFGQPGAKAATLQSVQARGHLVCGVRLDQPAIAVVDVHGKHAGFEIDICRAMAIAIFGAPDRVRFVPVEYIHEFTSDPTIDVILHGLTHTLERERRFDIDFSRIYFHDGQAFMVHTASGIQSLDQLRGKRVCLNEGGEAEKNLKKYADGKFVAVLFAEDKEAQDKFLAGQCDAYTADISLMISMVYGKPASSADYQVLPEKISKEPLSGITRRSDRELGSLLNATLAVIVEAEERGITAANIREQGDPENAKKLASFLDWAGMPMPSLPSGWALQIIQKLGNYGEIYERNLAKADEYGIHRGLNATWKSGGLLYALPMH
jgi:general L-amino acid transport system substrate-binding protein